MDWINSAMQKVRPLDRLDFFFLTRKGFFWLKIQDDNIILIQMFMFKEKEQDENQIKMLRATTFYNFYGKDV